MVNTLNRVVNIKELNEYTTMNIEEDNQANLAQKNLKRLNEKTVLPERMLKAAIEAWSKNEQILASISKTINDYCISSSINDIEVSMREDLCKINFVNSIKAYEDFCLAVILNDSTDDVWIVIKNSNFNNNKKYLRDARIFRTDNNCEINITIFDQKQITGLNEQLKSYDNYEVIEKNAK